LLSKKYLESVPHLAVWPLFCSVAVAIYLQSYGVMSGRGFASCGGAGTRRCDQRISRGERRLSDGQWKQSEEMDHESL